MDQSNSFHRKKAEAVGLEPTTVISRSCFQDSVLIRPGDFRNAPSKRSDVSGNRTRGLLDENQAILPSESTTPFLLASFVAGRVPHRSFDLLPAA